MRISDTLTEEGALALERAKNTMDNIKVRDDISKMRVVNLTEHNIRVLDFETQTVKTFPPSGTVARIKTEYSPNNKKVGGVPMPDVIVTGLPDPEEGTLFIVSGYVRGTVRDRDDLIQPDTTSVIRDNFGTVVGVKGLIYENATVL